MEKYKKMQWQDLDESYNIFNDIIAFFLFLMYNAFEKNNGGIYEEGFCRIIKKLV